VDLPSRAPQTGDKRPVRLVLQEYAKMEPIAPGKTKEMYLAQRREDVLEATLQAHYYRLKHLVRWCKEVEEITNLNELTLRLLFDYRQWRKEDGNLNSATLQTQLLL